MTKDRRADAPKTAQSLQARINNEAGGNSGVARRLQLLVADAVIGQMLPPGVIKGGAALQIRFGEDGARATSDLDAARTGEMELEAWLDAFGVNLRNGWEGFTGTITTRTAKVPDDVPEDYVMRRFQVGLAYNGSEWTTATFELMHDEVGSTDEPDVRIGQRALDLFALLGLPEPDPVPLLPVHHQIAQKLHACTSVGNTGKNERAHDLVDIQLLFAEESPDLVRVQETATRLFIARKRQSWPPTVVAYENWDTIYAAESDGLDVLPTVGEAIAWTNSVIARIDAA